MRALRWLGRNSYEAYLVHVFVVLLAVQAYRDAGLGGAWVPVLYGGTVAASAVLAGLLVRGYSRPLHRHFCPPPASANH